jgi:hypothetical protein
MTESRKVKSKRVKRVLNVIRSSESPVKKPKASVPQHYKLKQSNGGGFVSKKAKVVADSVQLSESSLDEFGSDIGDEELGNLDLDAIIPKDLKSKNKSTKNKKK